MLRAILGLIKGLLVGGGVGYGLIALGLSTNLPLTYAACAVVGALVGVIAGRAPWRAETIWTPTVKMIFGGLIGFGLCALGRRVLPDFSLPAIHQVGIDALGLRDGSVLAVAIGALYGIFVEVDDGGEAPVEKQAPPKLPAPKK